MSFPFPLVVFWQGGCGNSGGGGGGFGKRAGWTGRRMPGQFTMFFGTSFALSTVGWYLSYGSLFLFGGVGFWATFFAMGNLFAC